MTSKNIFGSWYYLDQDWEEGDEEKVSILSDSDGDFYYELTLPDGMEGDEAIAFLFLDFHGWLDYKPDSLSYLDYLGMLQKIFDIGVKSGKREQLKSLRQDLDNLLDLEDASEDESED